ncbi:uncharacterized protein LOC144124514 isoform X2 [Amblyomma americanum]
MSTVEVVLFSDFPRTTALPKTDTPLAGAGLLCGATPLRTTSAKFCFAVKKNVFDGHALEYAAWSPSQFAQCGAASHPSDW